MQPAGGHAVPGPDAVGVGLDFLGDGEGEVLAAGEVLGDVVGQQGERLVAGRLVGRALPGGGGVADDGHLEPLVGLGPAGTAACQLEQDLGLLDLVAPRVGRLDLLKKDFVGLRQSFHQRLALALGRRDRRRLRDRHVRGGPRRLRGGGGRGRAEQQRPAEHIIRIHELRMASLPFRIVSENPATPLADYSSNVSTLEGCGVGRIESGEGAARGRGEGQAVRAERRAHSGQVAHQDEPALPSRSASVDRGFWRICRFFFLFDTLSHLRASSDHAP